MSNADAALLRRYQPTFFLHPQEDALPIEPSAYIASCDLWQMQPKNPKKRHFKLSDVPSSLMLSGLVRSGAGTSLVLRGPSAPRGDIGSRLIARVIRYPDDRTLLVYAAFFAYNDAVDVLKCLRAGAHQADLEFVVIDLGAGAEAAPQKIWLSQHGDLVPHMPAEFITDDIDEAPAVFIAKGTHAMYRRAKRHPLFAGAAYDETRQGQRWRPDLHVIPRADDRTFDFETMGYTLYQGDMGEGHVSGFAAQDTWTDPLTAIDTSKKR